MPSLVNLVRKVALTISITKGIFQLNPVHTLQRHWNKNLVFRLFGYPLDQKRWGWPNGIMMLRPCYFPRSNIKSPSPYLKRNQNNFLGLLISIRTLVPIGLCTPVTPFRFLRSRHNHHSWISGLTRASVVSWALSEYLVRTKPSHLGKNCFPQHVFRGLFGRAFLFSFSNFVIQLHQYNLPHTPSERQVGKLSLPLLTSLKLLN